MRATRWVFPLLLRVRVVFLVILLLPAWGWARDHVLEKAYWTDATGTASFEQAQQASYTPYSGVLSKGFSKQVQWVRLRIDGVLPGSTHSLILRIRPVFLDEITLFDPAELTQGRMARSTGDRIPLASSEFESLNHSFVIPAQSTPRVVWLRLSSTSTQLMHVEALTPREMLREEHYLWLAYSALLALIFSCLLWVFISWLQDHDPVNGVFVLRQFILLIYTASYLGYHRILLDGVISAPSQDELYSWLVLLTTGLTYVFERRFLREYAIPAWANHLLHALLGTSVMVMALMLFGRKDWALHINMILNGSGVLCLLLISFFAQRPASPYRSRDRYLLPKSIVVAYYAMVVILLASSVVPSLGLMKGNLMSIYGVLLYGLSSGLFMTALLIVRSRQMERLRREEANHLFLSREQLVIETRRRQDQSQLLNMLMHELKTPLAVIDLALKDRAATDKAQGYVARAIDNMKSILNRCVQTDRLVERPFELHAQRFDLAQQVQQWLNDIQPQPSRVVLHALPVAMLETDLQCVQIIASNLIENALKYGDPQQPVHVTLQSRSHADGRTGLCLQVCNAPGAAGRPDADKVFTKYYRSASAQRQSGTGLGLFLSHNLAAQLGGTLGYHPHDPSIRFELWLPT